MKIIEALQRKRKIPLKKWRKRQSKNLRNQQILKESQEKVVNQVKEMVQDLKIEIEAIKPRENWKQKIWVNNQELQVQA